MKERFKLPTTGIPEYDRQRQEALSEPLRTARKRIRGFLIQRRGRSHFKEGETLEISMLASLIKATEEQVVAAMEGVEGFLQTTSDHGIAYKLINRRVAKKSLWELAHGL